MTGILAQSKGAAGEQLAADYLQRRGLKLIERNFRVRGGEIDLICRDGKTTVFVEVRLRSRSDFGGAAASVTPAKQKKLLAAARQYLTTLKTLPPCRFDVVALSGDGVPDWIKNAFDDVG